MNNMIKDTRYNEVFLYFQEEGHKYEDSLGNHYLSVTTFLHNYAPKFDEKFWARKKAKEQGVSEKEIRKQWEAIKNEACSRGTATHNGIEDAIKDVSMFNTAIKYLKQIDNGRVVTVADIPNLNIKPLDINLFKEATENKYPKIYEVFDFYIERGYTIYSEIGAFLIDYLISGTIDILCIKEDRFVILDWKTNRDGLKFEAGYYKKDKTVVPNQLTNEWVRKTNDRLLSPLGHMPNCNGSIYNMQLSMYAYMVESILGIPNVGIALCHIASPFILNSYGQPRRFADGYHVDENGTETVTWYPLKYKKEECAKCLKDRAKFLAAERIANNSNQLTLF